MPLRRKVRRSLRAAVSATTEIFEAIAAGERGARWGRSFATILRLPRLGTTQACRCCSTRTTGVRRAPSLRCAGLGGISTCSRPPRSATRIGFVSYSQGPASSTRGRPTGSRHFTSHRSSAARKPPHCSWRVQVRTSARSRATRCGWCRCTGAIAGGHSPLARALVEARRGRGTRGSRRPSRPLHEAAQNGDGDLVTYLLDHGADPAAEVGDGRTPAELAREHGHAGARWPALLTVSLRKGSERASRSRSAGWRPAAASEARDEPRQREAHAPEVGLPGLACRKIPEPRPGTTGSVLKRMTARCRYAVGERDRSPPATRNGGREPQARAGTGCSTASAGPRPTSRRRRSGGMRSARPGSARRRTSPGRSRTPRPASSGRPRAGGGDTALAEPRLPRPCNRPPALAVPAPEPERSS